MNKIKKFITSMAIIPLMSPILQELNYSNIYLNSILQKPKLVYAIEKNQVKIDIKDKTKFIQKISPIAREYGRKYNLWPSLIIANAIQESNYGTNYLTRTSNNLFKIKADKDWKGKKNDIPSKEGDFYRAYDNIEDSIKDFCKLIVYHNKYWPIANAANVYEALKFYETGYCTDDTKDKQLKNIIDCNNLKQYDTSLYGNYKKKDALKHPIKYINKQIDIIKDNAESKIVDVTNSTKYVINEAISASIGVFKASLMSEANKILINLFNLVTTSIIRTPAELVTSPQLNVLYTKILIVAIGMSAIFIVCGCISSMIDDSNINIFSVVMKGLKNIIVMMLSPIFIPIFVLWANIISKGFLSLGIDQVGDNILINNFLKENTGIYGILGFILIVILLIVFLIIVFLKTCVRYWQVCKLYILMPLALSISIMPRYNGIYLNWKNKFKNILLIQCVYAIHLGLFTILMSISFPKIIKSMLFMGGIMDLIKIPATIDDLFISNSNTTGNAKKVVRILASIKGIKGAK